MHAPELCRVLDGPQGSSSSWGNNGLFLLSRMPALERFDRLHPRAECDLRGLRVICSDGGGWEHVSVSRRDRCPTWVEMHTVKLIFWDDEDVVMQLHPAKSDYVNEHPFCLHMWRPTIAAIPTPPRIFV